MKILFYIGILLFLIGCSSEPDIPEHFGVYAVLKNGDIEPLTRMHNINRTKIITFDSQGKTSISAVSRAKKYDYIEEKPTVTLEIDDVKGFIVFGEKEITKYNRIYYFANGSNYEGKFFDNSGSGNKDENTFINNRWSCGVADGMKYKKIDEDMNLFDFPVKEKEGYKYCNLRRYKEAGKGTNKSQTINVDFYAWYYNGVYWGFNVQEEDKGAKERGIERKVAIAKKLEEIKKAEESKKAEEKRVEAKNIEEKRKKKEEEYNLAMKAFSGASIKILNDHKDYGIDSISTAFALLFKIKGGNKFKYHHGGYTYGVESFPDTVFSRCYKKSGMSIEDIAKSVDAQIKEVKNVIDAKGNEIKPFRGELYSYDMEDKLSEGNFARYYNEKNGLFTVKEFYDFSTKAPIKNIDLFNDKEFLAEMSKHHDRNCLGKWEEFSSLYASAYPETLQIKLSKEEFKLFWDNTKGKIKVNVILEPADFGVRTYDSYNGRSFGFSVTLRPVLVRVEGLPGAYSAVTGEKIPKKPKSS